MRMIVSQLWDGRRRVEGREGDQGSLGEGRSRRRETKRGGRVGMWPRQRRETESIGQRARRPYAPTGAKRNDDDDDDEMKQMCI